MLRSCKPNLGRRQSGLLFLQAVESNTAICLPDITMGPPGLFVCVHSGVRGGKGEKLLAFLTFQPAVPWLGYQSHPGRYTDGDSALRPTAAMACTNEQALLGHSEEAGGERKPHGDGARPEL